MKILVTGGLGFIGSHTVVELIANQHQVVIADNLVNSKIGILDKLEEITGVKPPFYQVDVTDKIALEEIFTDHHIDGVIHFAGLVPCAGRWGIMSGLIYPFTKCIIAFKYPH